MSRSVYVIFDDLTDASRAEDALAAADEVPDPVEHAVLSGPFGQDRVRWQESRAASGAMIGALVTALTGAVALGLAGAGGVLAISVPMAILAGLVGGAIYGSVLGAIAGSTEPKPEIIRMRRMLGGRRAALVARFDAAEDASRAERILLTCHGARASL